MYNFLESNNLVQLPNEEAALVLSSVAARDIQSSDVRTYFREQLLWFWKDPQNMAGTIQNALDSGTLPQELSDALGEMWSSLFGQSATYLKTNSDAIIASRIYQGIYSMVLAGVMTSEQMEGFYGLGGGLLYPGTTAEDVQNAKDKHNAEMAEQALEEARLEQEVLLRKELDNAMSGNGVEEAIYNGDKAALVVALNAVVAELEG